MRTTKSFPKLSSPALLSPMAGVTDVAFRTLAKRYGAGLTYTEFVNSTAITIENKKTYEMLRTDPSEQPLAVQLFGNSIHDIVHAAQFVEDRFDIIDVNCGCPAWKVIKTGAGSALLKNPEQIRRFVNKLASSVSIPVTVKIRMGITEKHINAVHVAKLVEAAGAAAIAIHGRTQEQGYAGTANWDIIKKVKEQVNIPVIGNGDVFTPEIFKQRLEESKVDAIMIARGALGNPFIFSQVNEYLKTGTYVKKDSLEQFLDLLPLMKKYNLRFSDVKNHALQFTKGKIGGARLREQLSKSNSIEEIEEILFQTASF